MVDEADVPAGAGKKKKLLIIAIAVVALALIGGGAAFFLAGGDEEAEQDEAAKAHQEPSTAIYEALGDKFVLTLEYEGRQHFMQVSISAMTRELTVGEELKVHAPLIRSRLVSLLGAQDFATLRTEKGKLALRDQVLATVQEVLQAETGKPGIEQVYFTDFVLQ